MSAFISVLENKTETNNSTPYVFLCRKYGAQKQYVLLRLHYQTKPQKLLFLSLIQGPRKLDTYKSIICLIHCMY